MNRRLQTIEKAIRPRPSTDVLRRGKSEVLMELVAIVESDDFDSNPGKQAHAKTLRKKLNKKGQSNKKYLYDVIDDHGNTQRVGTIIDIASIVGCTKYLVVKKLNADDTDFGKYTVIKFLNPDWTTIYGEKR